MSRRTYQTCLVGEPCEAMRLIPGSDNWKDVCDWIHSCDVRENLDLGVGMHGQGQVRFGSFVANPGDWVGRDSRGEFFACTHERFSDSYDLDEPDYLLAEITGLRQLVDSYKRLASAIQSVSALQDARNHATTPEQAKNLRDRVYVAMNKEHALREHVAGLEGRS